MAVSLIGNIINSCDATTGFNVGNISGDDDFVEGAGAIGVKASNTTQDMYTTSLTSGPYNFSSGGADEGYHIIMWFNTKTPINATTGLGIYVGNGTNFGVWDVLGTGFYKGGFTTRVIDPAADFDAVSGFTTTGNPAQLSAVSEVGGRFVTITSIMGSFNNVQLDQMTVGEGLRVDAGTVGTPNTFETVRAADEDTNFYGWWSSSNGAIVGKGKLYIGPATGTATSVFSDSATTVTFAPERVAAGFYEINTRGAGTDVTFDLMSISAADPTLARWSLTVQSDTNSFSDTNGVWSGGDIFSLNANSTLTGTTIINHNDLQLNQATIDGCNFLTPNGARCVLTDDLADVTNCFFESDGSNHAIELSSAGAGSMNWNNELSGYVAGTSGNNVSSSSTGNEAIYLNFTSAATFTINVASGATVPSIRKGAGMTGNVNIIAGAVSITVNTVDPTGTSVDTRVFVETATGGAGGSLPFEDSVSITRSGSTATVTHTAHGLVNGDLVVIRGADQNEYVGIKTISNATTNTYDFTVSGTPTTPATGTIVSSFVFISDTTTGGSISSPSRTLTVDQPIKGTARKATTQPYYKSSPIVGTIDSADGLTTTAVMILDE